MLVTALRAACASSRDASHLADARNQLALHVGSLVNALEPFLSQDVPIHIGRVVTVPAELTPPLDLYVPSSVALQNLQYHRDFPAALGISGVMRSRAPTDELTDLTRAAEALESGGDPGGPRDRMELIAAAYCPPDKDQGMVIVPRLVFLPKHSDPRGAVTFCTVASDYEESPLLEDDVDHAVMAAGLQLMRERGIEHYEPSGIENRVTDIWEAAKLVLEESRAARQDFLKRFAEKKTEAPSITETHEVLSGAAVGYVSRKQSHLAWLPNKTGSPHPYSATHLVGRVKTVSIYAEFDMPPSKVDRTGRKTATSHVGRASDSRSFHTRACPHHLKRHPGRR